MPALEGAADEVFIEIPGGRFILRTDYAAWLASDEPAFAPAGDEALPGFRAQHLYRSLIRAVDDDPPLCRGDWRFTADRADLVDAELAQLEATCDACTHLAQCRIFATRERPDGGFWAGRFYDRADSPAPKPRPHVQRGEE